MGIHVTKELIGFFFVQKRPHTSVYLFRDKHVGGMRVRVDGSGRNFALLCHSLSLFESQLDHCLSPFPAFIHCRSITERAIHTSLSNAGLARALPTEAERPGSAGPHNGVADPSTSRAGQAPLHPLVRPRFRRNRRSEVRGHGRMHAPLCLGELCSVTFEEAGIEDGRSDDRTPMEPISKYSQ